MSGEYTEFDKGSRFFSEMSICMCQSNTLHIFSHIIVKPCPLLGGSGGMLPQEKIKKKGGILYLLVSTN